MIETFRAAIASGATTSRALVESCLERAAAASGEGSRTFVHLFADAARAEADAIDGRHRAGIWTGVLGGVPVSVKDLFDIRGLPTTAGSTVLTDAPAATEDAVVVERLRAAGAVIIGRTNMTEFAFSGLGLNPHYGTPANPYDRPSRRIPGGSSSGAAVSICDEMAVAAIGTDTGGSTRVPLDGVLPLSQSLDSVGPLGRSVNCCRILDAVLSGQRRNPPQPVNLCGLRIAVPKTRVFDDIDSHIARTFDIAIATIADAGAQISRIEVPEFVEVGQTAQVATFPAAEGFAWHRDLMARAKDRYDPRVAERLERGRQIGATDYLWLVRRRGQLIANMRTRAAAFDVLAMPTVPIAAPPIADLERDDELYHRLNLLVLRNPTLVNFLDGCALSVPCHREGDAPVGLMLARFDAADGTVLGIGEAIEAALAVAR